jgi:ATP-dependent Lon protease
VILPIRNKKDLVDIPRKARNDLNIVAVEHMDEVLELALNPPQPAQPKRSKRKVSNSQKNGEKNTQSGDKVVEAG